MIKEIKMFGAQCDHCKKNWFDDQYNWSGTNDEQAMENILYDENWHRGDTKDNEGKDGEHYCPDCYSYDDQDNFILNHDRKDKYKK